MCLSRRNIRDFDPKTRRLWAAGNLCLFTSVSFSLFNETVRHNLPATIETARGFLLGLAFVFLLWSARRMRNGGSRA